MPGVRIRLAYHGCTNRPFFHIVVAASKFKRNGRHLEQVGTIDPMPNYNNEKLIALNVKRIKYWLGVGATPTMPVYKVLGLAGILPIHPRMYLDVSRKQKALEEFSNIDRTDSETESSDVETLNFESSNDPSNSSS